MKNNFNKHAAYRDCLAQGAGVCARKGRKLGIVLAGGLSLMLMLNVAMASLSSTKHNLGSTGVAGNNKFSGTTEICVFCHTPHGANNSVAKPAPIWNRRFNASSAYTTYDSLGTTTIDATAAPTGSVSLACLSCHDGTQAMNVMINTPGSGTVTTLSGTWAGAAATASPVGSLATAGKFTFIGTDLSNDHPVSIQYGGGGVSDSTLTGATLDPYFAQAVNSSSPNKRVGSTIGQVGTRLLKNNTRVWWVETNGTTGQQKDDLPLYSRTDLGTNQPFVECASCHDPHSNNTTFLRLPTGNSSSGVCLTCHIK
jgi:predicted CXXCH cytochrome family protein